jgi:transketolase
VPIVALHLTRPPVEVPDRDRLGIPSHFEAARGAYVLRPYRPGAPRGGTIIVQGSSAIAGVAKLLPDLDRRLNVKIVYATSPQLFAAQPKEYQDRVLSAGDRFDSTVLTTQARWLMHDWLFSKVSEEYAVSADWDDRWRTGGTLDEALDEAHLTPDRLLEGIERFVKERNERLARLRADLEATR